MGSFPITSNFISHTSLSAFQTNRADLELQIKSDLVNPANITNIAVGAFIFNPKSTERQLLLVRRSHGESAFPGRWEVPGGGAEFTDETVLHSVAREVTEETSLIVKNIVRLIDHVEFTGSAPAYRLWRKYNFIVEVEDGKEVVTDPKEHDDFKWVTEGEVLNGLKQGGWLVNNVMDQQLDTILEAFKILRSDPELTR